MADSFEREALFQALWTPRWEAVLRFALHAGEQVIFFDDGGALNVTPQMTQCRSMGVSFQVVAFSQIDYNIEYVQIQY